jgi:hypothetical protein
VARGGRGAHQADSPSLAFEVAEASPDFEVVIGEQLDFPRSRGHLTGIAGGLLEGHGTDAVKMTVTSFPIVKDLDVVE